MPPRIEKLEKGYDAPPHKTYNNALFRMASYAQTKWALDMFESKYANEAGLSSLPLNSNKLTLPETGYEKVPTGDSPRMKMANIPGRPPNTNPLKRPCMYSTLPPLSKAQCFKANSVS